MAQITSLESCFDYHKELNKVTPMIQNLIDKLRNEAKELEKNDIYYGAKTFSCEDYIPIKSKVNIAIKSISSICTELLDARASLKVAFYTKAKQDLTNYINYIENTYLAPNRKSYYYARDNINMGHMEEAKKYRTGYNTYKEYYPHKIKAEQKLEELERIYNSSMEG